MVDALPIDMIISKDDYEPFITSIEPVSSSKGLLIERK